MTSEEIKALLPYQQPFLFVDEIEKISEEGVIGSYTYPKDAFFYKGHFKGNPITPGVILTETMAQIGVVCLGIYLLQQDSASDHPMKIAMTSNQVDFFLPVKPGEKLTVISTKEYFRFNKLKCKVHMENQNNEVVCRGIIAGMITSRKHA